MAIKGSNEAYADAYLCNDGAGGNAGGGAWREVVPPAAGQ
jgi:hypothetical protein